MTRNPNAIYHQTSDEISPDRKKDIKATSDSSKKVNDDFMPEAYL